jgi:hypothetical protein
MPAVADTIFYLSNATVVPLAAEDLRNPVAFWLGELIISPAVELALNQIPVAPGNAYKSRRAMVLILCAINNALIPMAKAAVAQYKDIELPAKLGIMLMDVKRDALPKRLLPVMQSFLTNSAHFLAHNRVRIGSSGSLPSAPTVFELSWSPVKKMYIFDPPGGMEAMHINVQGGYNLGTTKFHTIGNLDQIAGSVAQGSFVLTTQLSGCSIVYSVNGGNLVVAHVWPDDAVKTNVPLAVTQAVGGQPLGVILGMRLIHEGGLSNPVNGGAFGVYGMVNSANDVGLRRLGPNNVRMHGYSDTYGHAYFIGISIGGNWHLFGQQNQLLSPNTGVTFFQQIYP